MYGVRRPELGLDLAELGENHLTALGHCLFLLLKNCFPPSLGIDHMKMGKLREICGGSICILPVVIIT